MFGVNLGRQVEAGFLLAVSHARFCRRLHRIALDARRSRLYPTIQNSEFQGTRNFSSLAISEIENLI